MTIFDRLFILADKLAKNPSKQETSAALNDAEFLSPEAVNLIEENLSVEKIQEQHRKFAEMDIDNDWKRVATRLPSRNRSRISKMYKVAAILLLLLSTSYLTYRYIPSQNQKEQVQTVIAPGAGKALLTLEDGSQVELDSENPFRNKVAQTNGDRLEYNHDNNQMNSVFNYLSIPRGGQYQLSLADGTEIWLNSDTKIKYPVAFQPGKTRVVELEYGEVYLKVSPNTSHNGDAFQIVTREQTVTVLGTEFNLKAYKEETSIYTTLVEGKITITVNSKKAILQPGEQAVWERNTHQLQKSEVNVNYDIAWIRGYFYFKDKPLKEIMQVLERWYNIETSFESPDQEKVKFSGLLSKRQNIEEILNGIRNTNSINAYEIKNNTVIIR